MKAIGLDINIPRIVLTKVLARVWKGVYFSPISTLRMYDIPRPDLENPHWVRVRPRLSGICGSDLTELFLHTDMRVYPLAIPGQSSGRFYLGHEAVSDVIQVGPAVTKFAVGDRVVGEGSGCLAKGIQPPCQNCAEGNYCLCLNTDQPGATTSNGAWSEEYCIHEEALFPVPDGMQDQDAVLIEPIACGVRAALRRPPISGERVLVYGIGTIGLSTLQAARAACPDCDISAIVQFPFQAELAERMGADRTLCGGDLYVQIAALTGARLHEGVFGNRILVGGFDVIYDCVGKAFSVENALRWTRAGGAVVLVGVSLSRMKLDLTPVFYREVNLLGTLAHGMETLRGLDGGEKVSDFELTVRWMLEGKIRTDGMLTHLFPLDDYRQAVYTAVDKRNTQSVKVAFDMGDI
jgi:threonine dehydrogenase-like Zn-dependent dehydrogenase